MIATSGQRYMTTSIIQSHKLDRTQPASKLSYLGKRSEPRENGRARGASRSRVLEILASLARIGELARRLDRTVLGHYQSGVTVQNAVYFRR